ncbi:class I SAM-dependent methyltransferase [Solirubrobacter pauli]|nr:class I SAM-dependent methyltransferase [Solirubrobacter pauli]
MVDWGAGRYETTAAELAPVAQVVVEHTGVGAGDDVVDVACGTGNAALLAAARGARVIGVDGAPRLLDVARERAAAEGVEIDLREGDLAALPVEDAAADIVVSVFGVIFAAVPIDALREIARILRPEAHAVITAWVPAGPIDAMLGAAGRVVARTSPKPPPKRFAWSDAAAVAGIAHDAGLELVSTDAAALPIRAASPEAYVDAGREHPMALAMRPALERAGTADEARAAMLAVLREANESPTAFLVHSPYVIHRLRRVG